MKKSIKIAGIIFLMLSGIECVQAAVLPKANDIHFIENKGQIVDQNYNPNAQVRYLLCRPGFNVQLRPTGFSYDTYSEQSEDAPQSVLNNKQQPPVAGEPAASASRHYHRVDVELLNCNPAAEIIADGRSASSFNYFTAGTPKGGVSDVHYYDRVIYKNIYPFIDLEFMDNENQNAGPAEYQFIIHPGGKVGDIQLSYSGADAVRLEKGELNIKVAAGIFTEKIPSSYIMESGQKVAVHYASLENNVYTFSMEQPFTITSDLVIDPVPCFSWGTYYGGNGWDIGSGVAVDGSNNVYVAGSTTSTNNIATAGAYQATFAGGILYDIIVAKFNPSGTTLLWGTYYGGTGSEGENGLAIDTSGVYITGFSHSTTLATTGAWQTTCPNCDQTYCDILVAKFSLTGALLWGTYYGTSGYGQGNKIAVNAGGVYVTGETYGSTGFSTPGAWQTTYAGGLDPFVAKFNLSGTQLLWGTYYGKNYNAFPWGICLDTTGNVYIAGWTDGPDTAKITQGAYQTSYLGGREGFVAKFNPTGTSLLYGTYYGGTGDDYPYDIAADASGNAFFTGWTTSTSGIATAGAWQTMNGTNNAFVAKLNPSGSSLLWGTYYGGSVYEESWSIALDAFDNIYISGGTQSPAGIATAGAYQTVFKGNSDAFIAKFNPYGNTLLWGTYYGGSDYENYGSSYLRIGGITLNTNNDVYITGFTSSYNGISSAGVWRTALNAGPDAFVAKFSCNSLPPAAAFSASDTTICSNDCIHFTDMSIGATSWLWSFPGANPSSSTVQNPQSVCYQSSGNYNVKLVASNGGGSDSITFSNYIHVSAAPLTPTITQVGNTLYCSTDPSYTSYQWYDSTAIIPGATDTSLVISTNGNYNVQVSSENGCKVAVGINVYVGIDIKKINLFSIYPNPAGDELTIAGLPLYGSKMIVEIFDILSRKIYDSATDQKNITIDLTGFPRGLYYIRLWANGESMDRKFIKE